MDNFQIYALGYPSGYIHYNMRVFSVGHELEMKLWRMMNVSLGPGQ